MPPTPIVKPKESPVQGVQTRQVRFYDGGSIRNNNTTQVHSPSSSPGESRQHTNFVDTHCVTMTMMPPKKKTAAYERSDEEDTLTCTRAPIA